MGLCKWNKVIAYTLTEMLERGNAPAVKGEISNVLRGYYDSLLHVVNLQGRILIKIANVQGRAGEDSSQEEKRILGDKDKMTKKMAETNQVNFEKIVEVMKYVIAGKPSKSGSLAQIMAQRNDTAVRSIQLPAQEYKEYIAKNLTDLYQLELAPDSYSRKHNQDYSHTPQKALFRALAFGAVNGNVLAAYFLQQEAEKFPADSPYLDFLVLNKIVSKRGLWRRLKNKVVGKQYDDISGLLPKQVEAPT